jgi:hypothetical protein
LARGFQFYQKKRGNRRTGSNALGSLGEGVFFGVFFLIGCIGLALILATIVVPDWRVNHEFVETQCTVLGKAVREEETEGGVLYRPEIRIEYRIGDELRRTTTYDIRNAFSAGREAKEAVLDRFTKDQSYPCWYDPADPDVVVLVRGYNWWFWLLLVVPSAFILIGGAGLFYTMLHWGKSAERRAAIVGRSATLPLFEGNGHAKPGFPNIPARIDVTDSPGTTLAFRLPVATSQAWAVLGSFALCVFWNGIVSIFAIVAVGCHLEGRPDWRLTIFTIPFLLVGLGTVYFFIRQFLVATGTGRTLVEISDHPLRPGQTCSLCLSQSGRLKMKSLELLLVCDEEATYQQGTNTRTETQRVYEQRIFRREDFEIQGDKPFDVRCDVTVPSGAMHSFKSAHNEISWRVLVKGDVDGWPAYQRSFPVIIYPSTNGTGGS